MDTVEDSLVECPACGEWVSPGIICEQCGEPLPEGLAAVSAAEPAPEAVPSAPQVPEEAVVTVRDEEPDSPPVVESDSECPDFVVKFNDARVFIEGTYSSFNFTIEAVSAEAAACKQIQLSVQSDLIPEQKKVVYGGRWTRPVKVDVGGSPKASGFDIPLDLVLSYRKYGLAHEYAASVLWDSFPYDEPPEKIIEHLEIRLEGMKADLAADQNINILNGLKQARTLSRTEQLQRLKTLKTAWRNVDLRSTDTGLFSVPLPHAPADAVTSRLTLSCGEYRLHLLSSPDLIIGRSSSCDLVARVFGDAAPGAKRSPDFLISRRHAELNRRSRGLELWDGAATPGSSTRKPSKAGTYVNGERIAHGKPFHLSAGHKPLITLAKPMPEEGNVFGLTCRTLERSPAEDEFLQSSGAQVDESLPPGAVLRRSDSQTEVYLCVWEYLSYKPRWTAFPENMRFIRYKHAFYFLSEDRAYPLVPGTRLQISDLQLKVGAWEQIGLTSTNQKP